MNNVREAETAEEIPLTEKIRRMPEILKQPLRRRKGILQTDITRKKLEKTEMCLELPR